MAIIKPFCGIRPPKHLVERISSRPYDVLNSSEAFEESKGNEMSLYHIIRPEIDFSPMIDEHDERVYAKAKENYMRFKQNGWLVSDSKEQYYVYAQTMHGKTQYGLVVAASVEDYWKGVIKKHELTRKDKEDDRMRHVLINNANIEPVFFTYPHQDEIDAIIAKVAKGEPEYDFVAAPEGFRHTFWVISDDATIQRLTALFAQLPSMYIADGHHRSAAAARVGLVKKEQNPNHTGEEEYNYFLAVCFPDNQLTVIDYNRVVKDLNGLTTEELLGKLTKHFDIEKKGKAIYHPEHLHNFALYVGGEWYSITAHSDTYNDADPIGVLDVTISSEYILHDILGIGDLRTDKRIDFVGGIRGLEALQQRVDSGEMALALALYPVTMQQIINIADSGNIMPPKTTWFEPKLRSGLIIHEFE